MCSCRISHVQCKIVTLYHPYYLRKVRAHCDTNITNFAHHLKKYYRSTAIKAIMTCYRYPEVAKQQEQMWEMKWAEMRQYLLDTSKAATQRKHSRPSATRRRRNTSTRSSMSVAEPVDIKQEIVHDDEAHTHVNGHLSSREGAAAATAAHTKYV